MTKKLKAGQTSLIILLMVVVGWSCGTKSEDTPVDDQVLVSINDHTLTRGDLADFLPAGLSEADSAIAAESYIKMWINDVLMFQKAEKNIIDKDRIEELVKNYRQSLTVFTYQEQLLKEKFSKELSDDVLKNYYNENPDKFKLEGNVIKGLFLKIPVTSPQVENFKKWYKSTSTASLENIEKQSLQNVVTYDYFYDKWVNFADIMSQIPYSISSSDEFLKKNSSIEVSDSTYVYLLNIKEYVSSGSVAPFDYIKPQVKEVLINQKKTAYIKQFEEDLYNTAVKDDKIKFYYKKGSASKLSK